MKLSSEPIKNWFGFSRRERRATFILLVLTVLIIGIRYILPQRRITVRDITGTDITAENLAGLYKSENESVTESSFFDRKEEAQDKYKQKRSSGYKALAVSGKYVRKENQGQQLSVKQKSLTNLNLSDSAGLERLPGIGPVLAARIIKYRRLLGGYATIEQLKEVYGLPLETFELIKGRVYADSNFITRININTAVYKKLARLHYLEKYEITAILKYRQLKGRIYNISDLTENKVITMEKARKVRPYLKYDE